MLCALPPATQPSVALGSFCDGYNVFTAFLYVISRLEDASVTPLGPQWFSKSVFQFVIYYVVICSDMF